MDAVPPPVASPGDSAAAPTATTATLADAAAASVRILTADSYLTRPAAGLDEKYSVFRSRAVARVPVLRVFGVTPAGQRMCAHVHGHRPYLYIPAPSASHSLAPGEQPDAQASASARRALADALDAALHRANRSNAAATGGPPPLVVAAVDVVVRYDFYGYHPAPREFWRIALYNPGLVKLTADLLQEGAVDDTRHQPYEAHVPYLLQFFTDYNLQGMNFVHAAEATFREPLPERPRADAGRSGASGSGEQQLDSKKSSGDHPEPSPAATTASKSAPLLARPMDTTAAPPAALAPAPAPETPAAAAVSPGRSHDSPGRSHDSPAQASAAVPVNPPTPSSEPAGRRRFFADNVRAAQRRELDGRHTTCELEIDFHVSSILNHHTIDRSGPAPAAAAASNGQPANPGLAALWEDERARRRLRGEPATFTPSTAESRVPLDPASLTANERYWLERLDLAAQADRALVPPSLSPPRLSSQCSSRRGDRMSVSLDADGAPPATPRMRDAVETLLDLYDSDEDDETRIMSQVWHGDNITKEEIDPEEAAIAVESEADEAAAIRREFSARPTSLPQRSSWQSVADVEPMDVANDALSTSRRRAAPADAARQVRAARSVRAPAAAIDESAEDGDESDEAPEKEVPSTLPGQHQQPAVAVAQEPRRSAAAPSPKRARRVTPSPFDPTGTAAASSSEDDMQRAHTDRNRSDRSAMDVARVASAGRPTEAALEQPDSATVASPRTSHSSLSPSSPSPDLASPWRSGTERILPLERPPETLHLATEDDLDVLQYLAMLSPPETPPGSPLLPPSPTSPTALHPTFSAQLLDSQTPWRPTPLRVWPLAEDAPSNRGQPSQEGKLLATPELLFSAAATPVAQRETSEKGTTAASLTHEPTSAEGVLATPVASDSVLPTPVASDGVLATPVAGGAGRFYRSRVGAATATTTETTTTPRSSPPSSSCDTPPLGQRTLPSALRRSGGAGGLQNAHPRSPQSVLALRLRRKAGSPVPFVVGAEDMAVSGLRGTDDANSGHPAGMRVWRFGPRPPTASVLLASMGALGLLLTDHQPAYFSRRADIPVASRTLAGDVCRWRPPEAAALPAWVSVAGQQGATARQQLNQATRSGQVTRSVQCQPSAAVGRVHAVGALSAERRCRWRAHGLVVVTPAKAPPTRHAAEQWLLAQHSPPDPLPERVAGAAPVAAVPKRTVKPKPAAAAQGRSQIEAVTQDSNPFGFGLKTQHVSGATVLQAVQHLTLLSMELFADSRGTKLPHPDIDPVRAIVYVVHGDGYPDPKLIRPQLLAVRRPNVKEVPARVGLSSLDTRLVDSELDLLTTFFKEVRGADPDVLLGYEIQTSSWGYIIQRGRALKIDVQAELSRLLDRTPDWQRKPGRLAPNAAAATTAAADGRNNPEAAEAARRAMEEAKAAAAANKPGEFSTQQTSEFTVGGRIILNLWRLMRHEVALNGYTFEKVAYHVLHLRVPFYAQHKLRDWYNGPGLRQRWRTLRYITRRALGNLQLTYELNLVGRTSEFARLFGILFFEVLHRGSQFRVESIMLRIAHRRNYVLISPSRDQVRTQRAPESLPLILEPESAFYTSPVLVLDFQSLYPSMMIAYNICYSTCLGMVPKPKQLEENAQLHFGVTTLGVPTGRLAPLVADGKVHVCPNGLMFVTSDVREGVLPTMLDELLRTRIMVKQAMKTTEEGEALHRLMNARQMGLKLIANVTYGYTSASFSGRMPCIDIADCVVQQARETLTRAMRMVEADPRWNAKVIYGDTDSMFVLLPGASREEAFRAGREMAAAVTASNPAPVKLKFEKVYLPCILQTKKRYVGYAFEHEKQTEPIFDAKGIETVRRDGCPAVQKVLERSLRLLFDYRDMSRLKQYLSEQWLKILQDRINLADFIIAKEYRGRDSYSPRACVAALEIANKLVRFDPRAEPRVHERVPYVIVCGPPRATLISLVRQPHELLLDPNLRLNATYYIRKQLIPPLERCFQLLGVDVAAWYEELPRVYRCGNAFAAGVQLAHGGQAAGSGADAAGSAAGQRRPVARGTIAQYYQSRHCLVCDTLTQGTVCETCRANPQRSSVTIHVRQGEVEAQHLTLLSICFRCTGAREPEVACVSTACPVYYERARLAHKLHAGQALQALDF